MAAESSRRQAEPVAATSSTVDERAAEASRFFEFLRQKTEHSVVSGIRKRHAQELALLEYRIANWPPEWGNELKGVLYGDFRAPSVELSFPTLGITVDPEKVTNSIVKAATCVLKVSVKTCEKSVKGVADATARMETLVGVLSSLDWGNSGVGWWSHITHGGLGGFVPEIDANRVSETVEAIGNLPAHVARKVRSALYWIREPRNLMMEGYKTDVLRVYAGYWNAFECLVDAVCLVRPQRKPAAAEKQAAIDTFVSARNGKLDAQAISKCYREIVNPGFVAKASHALRVCFPEHADRYIQECFRMAPPRDRLYDARNAIDHGEIDGENPDELLRVAERHSRLWMIVFGMLGRIIPIDRPLDEQ